MNRIYGIGIQACFAIPIMTVYVIYLIFTLNAGIEFLDVLLSVLVVLVSSLVLTQFIWMPVIVRCQKKSVPNISIPAIVASCGLVVGILIGIIELAVAKSFLGSFFIAIFICISSFLGTSLFLAFQRFQIISNRNAE